jgi:hypothetical protein
MKRLTFILVVCGFLFTPTVFGTGVCTATICTNGSICPGSGIQGREIRKRLAMLSALRFALAVVLSLIVLGMANANSKIEESICHGSKLR